MFIYIGSYPRGIDIIIIYYILSIVTIVTYSRYIVARPPITEVIGGLDSINYI